MEEVSMFRRSCRCVLVLLVGRLIVATPAAAQIIEPNPQPVTFPVLAGAEFKVDPQSDVSSSLFRIADRTLSLRTISRGLIDMEAYCQLPDRHWGPVSLISSTLEVSGQKPRFGPGIPSRVSLTDLPVGSTVKLRLLLQAPLIVLDLDGNPTAILDTFVEEYTWRITSFRRD
jgi:hypothetical protein